MALSVDEAKESKDRQALVSETSRCYKEALDEWRNAFTDMEEDLDFYVGDQWDEATKAKLAKENRPALSINNIKKSCDIVTGYAEQNNADIHVFPIESNDIARAEVYSEVIKWILLSERNKYYIPYAFKSAVHTGLGWMSVDVRFERDILDGDVFIRNVSPFHIVADPNFSQPDLSDCQYIIRYSYCSKSELKSKYPDLKDEIEKLSAHEPTESDETIKNQKYKGKKVIVKERWYRSYETKRVYYDNGEVVDISGLGLIELAALKVKGVKIISKQVSTIRMCTTANDSILLYDGPNPLGIDMYPFIPVFGWYTPDHNDWRYRIQGMVRILKDSQREKNKRRSQLMSMSLRHFGGYFYEPGAFNNLDDFTQSKGGFLLVQKNPDKNVTPIAPPQMSQSVVELEQFHSNDMKEIGPNPDLLGQMMSKSEPGMNVQLRQKQGMMAIQDLFENLSFSKGLLGKILIEIINTFTPEKIERIIGRPVPADWEKMKQYVKMDTSVDEVADSPSYRMGLFELYKQMQQQGIPIPPQVLLGVAEMPKKDREKIQPLLDLQQEVQISQLKLQKLQIDSQIAQMQAPVAGPTQPPSAQIGQGGPPPDAAGQAGISPGMEIPADGSQNLPAEMPADITQME